MVKYLFSCLHLRFGALLFGYGLHKNKQIISVNCT